VDNYGNHTFSGHQCRRLLTTAHAVTTNVATTVWSSRNRWGGNRGYEDVRRPSSPRYRDGQNNERDRPTPQQRGRGTLTASQRPLLIQQPIQPTQNGPGIWTSRCDFNFRRQANNGCYVCGRSGCHTVNHPPNQRGNQPYRPSRSAYNSPARHQPENDERNSASGN